MHNICLRSFVIGAGRWSSNVSLSKASRIVSTFRGVFSISGTTKVQLTSLPGSRLIGRAYLSTSHATNAIKSDLPDLTIPEIPVTEHVFKDFRRFGDRPALIDALTGQSLSFPELRDAIWRTASGLRRNGVKKNDVVMVISENNIDYVIATHAILSIGGTITMANPMSPTSDLKRQADDSEASFLMASLKCGAKAIEVSGNIGSRIKRVFVFGNEEFESCVPFKSLLSDSGSLFTDHEVVDSRSHVAVLPYSSGTTGLPKGVMLSHYTQVANSMQLDNDYLIPVREGAIQLAVLPFYHIYAFMGYTNQGLACGQTTVILPSFDQKLFLESIKKYQVNLTHVVPPMVLFLVKHPMVAAADLSSLRRIISAAAPLGQEMILDFHDKHPHCVIGQGYGMTETGPAVTLNSMKDSTEKPGSSGKLLPGTELKIVDLEDSSKECQVGKTGELCVRGPQVMLGYLKRPKETSDMIDKDGWLHTGDIAFVDKEKSLFVCDRVKELIKYNALQVPPAELEAVLDCHPAVADSCVIGIPDPETGEVPKAFVALRRDSSATAEELKQFVADKVAGYKKLRGGVEFVKEIPRSPSGKIMRRLLRDQKI